MGSAVSGKATVQHYTTRLALHAGSWYESDPDELDQTLEKFLRDAETTLAQPDNDGSSPPCLRAVICPHAGYSYAGPTAAYSYAALKRELAQDDTPIRRVLVLHPSHHVYLDGCAVSGAAALETPLGDLPVDDELRREILNYKGRHFTVMDKKVDEREHSGEMQYPFLAKILKDCNKENIPVLPIMCGAISTLQEELYGNLLNGIIARPDVLTVVSTDFCHWGARFSFQPHESGVPIHTFIERMDRQGMQLIELQKPGAFADYLKETRNTICGRHAIAVWMRAVTVSNSLLQVKFIRYDQSSSAQSMSDSSVSYSAAIATL